MSNLNGQPQEEGTSRKEIEAANVTAYALGQLHGEEMAQFEAALLREGLESVKNETQAIQSLAAVVRAAGSGEQVAPSAELRTLVELHLHKNQKHVTETGKVELPQRKKRWWQLSFVECAVIGGLCCVLAAMLMPAVQVARESARRMQSGNTVTQIDSAVGKDRSDVFAPMPGGIVEWQAETAEQPTRQLTTTEIALGEAELRKDNFSLEESLAQVKRAKNEKEIAGLSRRVGNVPVIFNYGYIEPSGTEQYSAIHENTFLSPLRQALSTFSIDVDTASYSNVRRFLTSGQLPPHVAVRIEELVNYFRYEYPRPRPGEPFSVSMELAECPWREGHRLLSVGLAGREVPRAERPASNLVFLLDVSGSMADENKLPLLKTAMKMLAGELGEDDRVAIVTYAGEAGLKMGSTRGHEQAKITRAIDSLRSGGSTNGSAGIELAYEQATAGFIASGTNRVILCTDGDLNVGITSDEALTKLIKQKAKSGVFLTVLGFGEGNLQDAKLERLADNGNGLYAYIDSVREARKVLVEQLTGSTITIAKDVKIQIEFNPAQVAAYRLLGYENRVLAAPDFNNDKKDAGEIGAGHTVTALFELVLADNGTDDAPALPSVDPLRYQPASGKRELPGDVAPPINPPSSELATLKLRYKEPAGEVSKLLEHPLSDRGSSFSSASADFQFAAAVASFGMILRGSEHRGTSNLAAVAEVAAAAMGDDPGGYRAEFVDLVRKAQTLGAR